MQSVNEFEYSQSDLLGHGAFALVFKGRQKKSHHPVAIKQIALKSVPGKLSNIRQKEITILKDLRDVNIVQLYDYVETLSDIFLVMEYCNGGDLGDYLVAKKTLSENSIRHLARHIAGALRALQRLHIIHRDIKPQNLLLSYPAAGGNGSAAGGNGSTGGRRDRPFQEATIKLADFGFARYLQGTDMAATLCGSPLYMAPEILLGRRYDSKADLWSVGTILFQCLSGNAPFLASNPHALRKRYEKENLAPKIPAGTSQYLAELLLQLLRKQPTERLSYDEFFSHDFLKDPSSLPSDVVFGSCPPPPHTKSSPVPIKRHNAKGLSPHTSPRLSGSPHRGSSIDYVSLSPSSASGPPLSHRVGSQGSLPYYSAHSSSSDVTDQGFILVDLPGSNTSTTGSRRCSLPTSDHHSTSAASPGSCSSTGHGHSHTPSSGGSLTRYTSLTTPFYKVPLPRQPIATVQCGFVPSGGTTPTNINMESPQMQGLISHNIPTLGSNPQPQGFYFKSSNRRRSDNSLQLMARSPPLPFGKLIHNPYHHAPPPPSSSSLSSSPHSQSGSSLNLYRHSPLSTPPSANLPSPSGVGVAIGVASPPGRSTGHGMKYSLTPHGSGTKLSSLAEETDLKKRNSNQDKRSGSQLSSAKGKTPPIKVDKPPSITGNFITHSCLLNSDDEDNEIDNEGATEDEENFPLSLSLTSSVDSTGELGQQISMATATRTDPFNTHARYKVRSPERSEARYRMQSPEHIEVRPMSARDSKRGSTWRGERKLQRAASFSQQRSHRLTNELADIRQQAFSLSTHGDPLDPHFTAATLITGASPDIDVSPSSGIVAFKLPFVFSSSGSQDPTSSSLTGGRDSPKFLSSSPLRPGSEGWEVEQWEESPSSSCLMALRHSYVLGRELLSMAKARQGPIMLLSTELSDSGVASRLQRCSEQLVLVAKAISILESGLRQYQIEQAAADIGTLEETTSLHAKKVEVEIEELLKVCVGEARQVREQQQHYIATKGHQHSLIRVSAERLLCLEALDMCKSAILNEQYGETKECVKRYRRARQIFQFLLAEAHTQHDKAILSKYMQSIESRIQQLLASL